MYETDISNARWAEVPSWVLKQVEAIRAQPPERDPREAAAELRRQAERKVRRLFRWRAPVLLWCARKLRQAMAVREACKSAMVSMLLPVRRAMREVGRRLVTEGRLDSPEQMFHFSHADVICLLRGYWDGAGARELASDRACRREAWLAGDCPDVITESPQGNMMPAALPDLSSGAAAEGVWSGIAVSPGTATGLVAAWCAIRRMPPTSSRETFSAHLRQIPAGPRSSCGPARL